ncbi:MAG: ribonuclease III [Rhodocyclaceae bacterium]|nr:ribonuclease III [Rhodocyclaceae bacterium]
MSACSSISRPAALATDRTLGRLQQALGHTFRDTALLGEALTHRSFGTPHNERLEFLGDSILNCAIAIALYRRFGSLREGELSRMRANLVRQEALHRIALSLDLGDCLRLGEGELKSGGFRRPSILADAVEALFAAVYLDADFDVACAVIGRQYEELMATLDGPGELKDPKTTLQEWLQGRKRALPRYELVEVRGEAHAQEFEVRCVVERPRVSMVGHGSSRRSAEQQAAKACLEELRRR